MKLTVRDMFILAVSGMMPNGECKTARGIRVAFESNHLSTLITFDGRHAALIDPANQVVHLASIHGSGVPNDIRMIGHTLEDMGYWHTGEVYGDGSGSEYMDVWHRNPPMYLMTDSDMAEVFQTPMREWMPGDHQYIMGKWSPPNSAVLAGVSGHHVFAEIPNEIPHGFRIFAVEYRGPHDVRKHSDGHMAHAFGQVKPLHEVLVPVVQ